MLGRCTPRAQSRVQKRPVYIAAICNVTHSPTTIDALQHVQRCPCEGLTEPRWLVATGESCILLHLLQRDLLLLASKVVIFGEEEHAVALLHAKKPTPSGRLVCAVAGQRLGTGRKTSAAASVHRTVPEQATRRRGGRPHLALSHGYARAVPVALLGLGGLIVIVPAGAQRRAEVVLVLSEALDDDGRHRFLGAKVRACPLGVLLRELAHDLQALVGRLCKHARDVGTGRPVAPSTPGARAWPVFTTKEPLLMTRAQLGGPRPARLRPHAASAERARGGPHRRARGRASAREQHHASGTETAGSSSP